MRRRIPQLTFAILQFPALVLAEQGGMLQLQPAQQNHTPPAGVPQLNDIYGPLPVAEPPQFFWYVLLLLLLLLLVAAGYRWYARRLRSSSQPLSPESIAREELIRAKELMNLGHGLEYMECVSDILRRFLESRYSLPTTRQTTGELLQQLASTSSNIEPILRLQSELATCLRLCDLAKFAHRSTSQELMQEMESVALTVINSSEQPSERVGGGDQ